MKLIDLDAVRPEGVSHDPAILKRVALRKGDVPHVAQLARAVLTPGQVAHGHAHADMWEIFVCESGSGAAIVDDTEVPLRAGRCLVVEPGERHELRNDGRGALTVTVLAVVSAD